MRVTCDRGVILKERNWSSTARAGSSRETSTLPFMSTFLTKSWTVYVFRAPSLESGERRTHSVTRGLAALFVFTLLPRVWGERERDSGGGGRGNGEEREWWRGKGEWGKRARKRERGGREGEIVSDGFNTLVSWHPFKHNKMITNLLSENEQYGQMNT